MVVEAVTGFGYEFVENAWIVATVLTKYVILGIGILTYGETVFTVEKFSDNLLKYSNETVTVIAILGLLNVFTGFITEPVFKMFGEVVAFLYFMFLFWKY